MGPPLMPRSGLGGFTCVLSFTTQDDDGLTSMLSSPLVSDGKGSLRGIIYDDKRTAYNWQKGDSSPGAPLPF